MNPFSRITAAFLCVVFSQLGQAASISNFQSTYDVVNDRIQYSFDLVPVDGDTPTGVDEVYFNYNPEDPPNPYTIGTTTLLDSSVGGTTISIFDADEVVFVFPSPLTTPTSVVFILGNVDAASVGAAASYALEVYVNPSFGTSSLIQQILGDVETQADYSEGAVASSIAGSAPAATPVPSTPVYTLILLAIGLLLIARGRLLPARP